MPEVQALSMPAILEIENEPVDETNTTGVEPVGKIESLTKVDLVEVKLKEQQLQENDLRKMLVTRRETEAQYYKEWKNKNISTEDYRATLREIESEKKLIKQQIKDLDK